jgi:glucosyl-dolichyl phosphate glucuronosyltransferase
MPEASVIIPTYNRSQKLKRALESLIAMDFPKGRYEIVVVDNNSNDNTADVVRRLEKDNGHIRYIIEPRLSFTRARNRGADEASTDILCYIDDDVIVDKGWLSSAIKAFGADEKIGMIGGPIKPIFEKEPDEWALFMQSRFNGWSLRNMAMSFGEVRYAGGPNLCIRKHVLKEAGGFPPDTIGVESAEKPGTLEKIYIGPGDWGLGKKVREAGYKVMYSEQVLVHHIIPPVRMTKDWWRSRIVGEACMHAFSEQVWEERGPISLLLRALSSLFSGCKYGVFFIKNSVFRDKTRDLNYFNLLASFRRSKVEFALSRNPGLAKELWNIAACGIDAQKLVTLKSKLPWKI